MGISFLSWNIGLLEFWIVGLLESINPVIQQSTTPLSLWARLPCKKTSAQVCRAEAALLQKMRGDYAAAAGGAINHDLAMAVGFQFLQARAQLVQRDIKRVRNVPLAIFAGSAHVKENEGNVEFELSGYFRRRKMTHLPSKIDLAQQQQRHKRQQGDAKQSRERHYFFFSS
jgi:hypothetical protein